LIYGYAHVSTDGQSVSAQVAQLKEAGATTAPAILFYLLHGISACSLT
jgi:hypothetical protein